MNKKKMTMQKLAKKCGVSASTVSNVLNGKDGMYSEEIKEKVLSAADQYGYKHRRKRKQIRLIFIQDLKTAEESLYVKDLIDGIRKECSLLHFDLHISYVNQREWKNALTSIVIPSQCDGALISAPLIAKDELLFLKDLSIPFVILDSANSPQSFNSLALNNSDSTYELTERMIKKHHEVIGFIGFSRSIAIFNERFQGYCHALDAYHLAHDPIYDFAFEEMNMENIPAIEEKLKKMMRLKKQPTAFCAANDYMAIIFLMAAKNLGLQFSVTGFDDFDQFPEGIPPVTSAHINQFHLGQTAVQVLLRAMTYPDLTPVKVLINTTIKDKHSIYRNTK